MLGTLSDSLLDTFKDFSCCFQILKSTILTLNTNSVQFLFYNNFYFCQYPVLDTNNNNSWVICNEFYGVEETIELLNFGATEQKDSPVSAF